MLLYSQAIWIAVFMARHCESSCWMAAKRNEHFGVRCCLRAKFPFGWSLIWIKPHFDLCANADVSANFWVCSLLFPCKWKQQVNPLCYNLRAYLKLSFMSIQQSLNTENHNPVNWLTANQAAPICQIQMHIQTVSVHHMLHHSFNLAHLFRWFPESTTKNCLTEHEK